MKRLTPKAAAVRPRSCLISSYIAVGGLVPGGEEAQPARLADGGGQLRAGDAAGHRRLHDGYAVEIGQRGGHGPIVPCSRYEPNHSVHPAQGRYQPGGRSGGADRDGRRRPGATSARSGAEPPAAGARAALAGRSTAVEGVLQPGEQPLLARLELAGGPLLAAQLAPARAAVPPAPASSLVGVVTSTWTIRSPRPPPRRCVMPRSCSGIDWPDWVPGRMSISSMPSSVSSGHLGAERRRRHGDGDRAVQVVAAPLEDRVRQLVDLHVQVAGRTAAGADLALAARAGYGCRCPRPRGSSRSGCAASGPGRRPRTRGRGWARPCRSPGTAGRAARS